MMSQNDPPRPAPSIVDWESSEKYQRQQREAIELRARRRWENRYPPPDERGGYEPGRYKSDEQLAEERYRWRKADAKARERLAEDQAAEFADEWFGETLEDFDPGPEPVPCVLRYAEDRHAFAPGVRILFGKRSSLKSWIALEAIRQELARGDWAMLIDYEMSKEKAARRLIDLGAEREHLARFVYVSGGPVSDKARAAMRRRFEEAGRQPSVVVIDSIGLSMAAAGFSTNDDTETGEWYTAVPRWMTVQWPDTAVLLIDHTPKGNGSASDPIGSQRKGAFADGMFRVEKVTPVSKATRGGGVVSMTKDRDGDGEEDAELFKFEFGGGGPLTLALPDPPQPGTVTADLSDAGLSSADEAELRRIACYVGEHEGVKVDTARADLGISSNEFNRLKSALVAQGVIEHRTRAGLFKGLRWEETVTAS